MSDLISRQAAIKAIEEEWDECCSEYPATQIIRDTTEAIERLPIIQPKRGRWIGKYPVTSVCSECGFLIHDSKVKVFAFCPNCGAKMEVTTPPECEGDCGWCKPTVIEKCKGVTT